MLVILVLELSPKYCMKIHLIQYPSNYLFRRCVCNLTNTRPLGDTWFFPRRVRTNRATGSTARASSSGDLSVRANATILFPELRWAGCSRSSRAGLLSRKRVSPDRSQAWLRTDQGQRRRSCSRLLWWGRRGGAGASLESGSPWAVVKATTRSAVRSAGERSRAILAHQARVAQRLPVNVVGLRPDGPKNVLTRALNSSSNIICK